MTRPAIDPAFGLDLVPRRTLERQSGRVSVVVPAHNEAETIAEVVGDAFRALELLKVEGEVLVSASGCTDATASIAADAGARVVEAPIGKGVAVRAGLAATDGEVVCLVDGDVRYFGDRPLVTILAEPILHGIADAVITDLYWRPLYPQMWLHGFFAPLAGYLFPELLPKAGSTPWSGQRAALRHLWPLTLPDDFTVDLELLLHWNRHALRLRPVLADDWINPQRPKPDLMAQELDVVVRHAVADGRIGDDMPAKFARWYESVHVLMAQYRPDVDQPQDFEQALLMDSMCSLRKELAS
jgi:Glycosyltransferases involved in cell wall biogenesis